MDTGLIQHNASPAVSIQSLLLEFFPSACKVRIPPFGMLSLTVRGICKCENPSKISDSSQGSVAIAVTQKDMRVRAYIAQIAIIDFSVKVTAHFEENMIP